MYVRTETTVVISVCVCVFILGFRCITVLTFDFPGLILSFSLLIQQKAALFGGMFKKSSKSVPAQVMLLTIFILNIEFH